MNLEQLNKVAAAMATTGRGILAADKSTGTIGKRSAYRQRRATILEGVIPDVGSPGRTALGGCNA
jgi:hypothetical protein